MSRRPALFRQSDLARAIRAAKQAGVTMAVEISDDGKIRMIPAMPIEAESQDSPLKRGIVL